MKIIPGTVLLLAILTAGNGAVAALSVDDHVKTLMRRYEHVEEQLPRSVHYSKKETFGDETTTNQAWFNGAGDLIKVATEKTASGRRELTEYFAATKIEEWQPMFILTRKETTQSDNSVQVDESRQYFDGNADVIRELRKSGHFKPGDSLDTVHVKNAVVNLSKELKDERSDVEKAKARNAFYQKPAEIAAALKQSGPPVSDPFANVTGDSEKYRVIQNSISPDGRYAIALGLAREKINWEEFRDTEIEPPGEPFYTAEEEDVRNYVVDLLRRKILGVTGVDYFGTKQRYNHRVCDVVWSPDSKNFVETYSGKWTYETCRAGRVTDGPKLVGTVELGKYAEKVAQNFRKTHKHRGEEGSIAIFVTDITNDGTISLSLTDQESSGERKGDVNFSVDEKIRLHEKSGALQLETVNVRKAAEQ